MIRSTFAIFVEIESARDAALDCPELKNRLMVISLARVAPLLLTPPPQPFNARAAPPTMAFKTNHNDLQPFDDLYAILGAPRDASATTLRSCFRTAARRHHPDTSDSPDEARFRKVVAAYAVLSDKKKRQAWFISYDRSSSAPDFGTAFRTRRKAGNSRTSNVRWDAQANAQANAPRPWIYEVSDNKAVRLFLALAFIGGQWFSWYLFLWGAAHVPVHVATTICGIGPCAGSGL